MNRNDYIFLGERLFNYVRQNSGKSQACRKNECRKLILNTDDILEFTKDENRLKQRKFLFGRFMYDWYEWNLELVHKVKSKSEVLSVNLKQNDKEVMTGAFLKNNKGAMSYHFTNNNILLQTGNTANTGYLIDYRKTAILPEKFYDLLWIFDDKTLIWISKMFGIGGKKYHLDEIAKESDTCHDTIYDRKVYYLKLLNSLYNSDTCKRYNKTEPNGYTVVDYMKALREIKNNRAAEHLDNIKNGNLPPGLIINDDFLIAVKQAKICNKIINEWRENVKELR